MSSLFQRGVGVDVVCVCVYAHTHTLHVGYSDLSQGVVTRQEEEFTSTRHEEDCTSTKCPHTLMPYMSTIYTSKYLFFVQKQKKYVHAISRPRIQLDLSR